MQLTGALQNVCVHKKGNTICRNNGTQLKEPNTEKRKQKTDKNAQTTTKLEN